MVHESEIMLQRCHRIPRLLTQLSTQTYKSTSRLQQKYFHRYPVNVAHQNEPDALRFMYVVQPLLVRQCADRTRPCIEGRINYSHKQCSRWLHQTVAGWSGLSAAEVKKRKEEITDKFFEARELLDDARASADTVYFNEDVKEAQEAVQQALRSYDNLLGMLTPEQKNDVVGSIGLKMEELKAQQTMIEEMMA